MKSGIAKVAKADRNLNFKVTRRFYREFKITAALEGVKMRELLEMCFHAWKNNSAR